MKFSKVVFLCGVVLAGGGAAATAEVLVGTGAPMSYLANVGDPMLAESWVEEGFDDSLWFPGSYGLGYENGSGAEGLIVTPVPPGSMSVYTRARFEVADASQITSLFLGVDYDDGYIAWLNGVEVARSAEMPAGPPAWDTVADVHESGNGVCPVVAPFLDISALALPVLHNGTNVLAVGVWNHSPSSSDLLLVPELVSGMPQTLVRPPSLQLPQPTSMSVRWRTTLRTSGTVRYGTSADALDMMGVHPVQAINHQVTLSGLAPDTTYYYTIEDELGVLPCDRQVQSFHTPPLEGVRDPYRVWVIGNSGTADSLAVRVRDAYLDHADVPTDAILMLGDNALPLGRDAQISVAVFQTYAELLAASPIWPTLGDRDALSADSSVPSGAYYDAFELPAGGESGGVPSGTEAFYGFDLGNIHFIVLNSADLPRTPGSAMLDWLALDLAGTAADWIVALWHHAPYSKGDHDSDSPEASEVEMAEMRQNVVPILESAGVDLVLASHSATYERTVLLDGHYGTSDTLAPSMMLDSGDGRLSGDGAYRKLAAGPDPHSGTVYAVVGTSGLVAEMPPLGHPAMAVSLAVPGSFVLDVVGDRLEGRFLDDEGLVQDEFTIVKNSAQMPLADFTARPLDGPSPLEVSFEDLSSTNVTGWSWDFEADGIADSSEREPTGLYIEPGTYAVELTVSNDAGTATETKTEYITVGCAIVGETRGLVFGPAPSELSWNDFAGTTYDVVKGDLVALRAGAGDFTGSLETCLLDDGADPLLADPSVPVPGGGLYYLVRAKGCDGLVASYNASEGGLAAGRDRPISISTQACP